jgi:hypothetical protein
MFRAFLAGIVLVIGTGLMTTPSAQTPAGFSLVLESTATGWAARCDSGCRWTHITLSCARSCDATIDANGVRPRGARSASPSFAFNIERTGREVRATGRTGTAWQALTWTCFLDPCRARVNTYGVFDIGLARSTPDKR